MIQKHFNKITMATILLPSGLRVTYESNNNKSPNINVSYIKFNTNIMLIRLINTNVATLNKFGVDLKNNIEHEYNVGIEIRVLNNVDECYINPFSHDHNLDGSNVPKIVVDDIVLDDNFASKLGTLLAEQIEKFCSPPNYDAIVEEMKRIASILKS